MYHISHPNVIRWSTILDGLERGGLEFKRIDARLWLEKLEKNLEEDDPSRQMLGMWKTAVRPFEAFLIDTDGSMETGLDQRDLWWILARLRLFRLRCDVSSRWTKSRLGKWSMLGVRVGFCIERVCGIDNYTTCSHSCIYMS